MLLDDLLIAIVVVAVYVIFFVPANLRLTNALFEWTALSKKERISYCVFLWLVPIIGQIVAYKKSRYDISVGISHGGMWFDTEKHGGGGDPGV